MNMKKMLQNIEQKKIKRLGGEAGKVQEEERVKEAIQRANREQARAAEERRKFEAKLKKYKDQLEFHSFVVEIGQFLTKYSDQQNTIGHLNRDMSDIIEKHKKTKYIKMFKKAMEGEIEERDGGSDSEKEMMVRNESFFDYKHYKAARIDKNQKKINNITQMITDLNGAKIDTRQVDPNKFDFTAIQIAQKDLEIKED